MARQAVLPGLPFPVLVAETGTLQAIASGTLVGEGATVTAPASSRPRLIQREPVGPVDAPKGTLAATLLARTYQVWRDNPVTRRRDILAKLFGA